MGLSEIVDGLASIIEDLMGCAEGDEACKTTARKYAARIIYISIIAIILFVAIKGYKFFKGSGK